MKSALSRGIVTSLTVVACLSVVLVLVCCSGEARPNRAEPAADTTGVDETLAAISHEDSLNIAPLFEDSDGRMATLFAQKGYVFGADIVKAAQTGDVGARYLLAQMYSYGIGGAKPDRRNAFRLYVGLADEGLHEAQAIAGYMMVYGLGTEENFNDGMQLMAEAANQDDGLAYLFLGNFYSKNAEPSRQNLASAMLYYRNAVRLGVSSAQAELDALEARMVQAVEK